MGGLLFDHRYGLVGMPDGYIRLGKRRYVPVEFKQGSGRSAGSRARGVGQLYAYCLLFEAQGWRVPYGLLVWESGVWERVEWGSKQRRELEGELQRLRSALESGNYPRTHTDSDRCKHCLYNEGCPARLQR